MLTAMLFLSGACTQKAPALKKEAVKPLTVDLPPDILGLRVTQEDVAEELASKVGTFYVDGLALFSLREEEKARATLQISVFKESADYKASRFQQSVISLSGASAPEKLKVGDATVYSTTGNQQTVYIWFRGKTFYVLTIHVEYEQPKTLVRTVVGLAGA